MMSDDYESDDNLRSMPKPLWLLGLFLAIVLVVFHMYTAGFGRLSPLSQRAFHVGLLLVFLAVCGFGAVRGGGIRAGVKRALQLAIAIFAAVATGYILKEETRLTESFGVIAEAHEMVFAIGLTALVIYAARRTTGWALPILAVGMLAYALYGNLIPGYWGHPGMPLDYLIEHLYLGAEGMWGTVTGLSANLIAIFIIFGAFLMATGAANSFMDLAMLIAGRFPGGAAKVSCISSAMFGMLNGAAVANVATTGNFTIPSMKRLGYRPSFAGAVEATGSSGGQITPPIMGAGAFVMAELLGVPYTTVVYAAILPAIMFFVCVWLSIDVEARREQMRAFDASEIPKAREVLTFRRVGPLLLTLGITIGIMFSGYTPEYAAFLGICTNLGLYLIMGGVERVNFVQRLRSLLKGIEMAAVSIGKLMPLLVAAQIVLSLIGVTGIGIKLSEAIISVGDGGGLLLGTLLAAVVALVMGMGMPTTAAYLLAAAVAAPALIQLGLDPLVAHFFVFYSALLSALTPPVCTAVFTAAAIARTPWWPVCVDSMRLALMKYLLPFFFVFRPSVLLEGTWQNIAWTAFMAFVASWLLAVGSGRFFRRRIPSLVAVVLVLAGIGVAADYMLADAFALAVAIATVTVQLLKKAPNGVEVGKPSRARGL
ncbi:TRAP transporter permease [Halomonas korlensis]|uniref:TRAP transporter, 4TM/12TM fusion protein n=1 Tax=Halomonas korlensis TaxID=463301 RepID=A0A1I7GIG9_9GAMM|nr:TRAP transporter fused permease subunit [Halomonas korlensis]SFU48302.1 TRAP transporter, 4TM/12TM fusion protein [Halomonas korlensis]